VTVLSHLLYCLQSAHFLSGFPTNFVTRLVFCMPFWPPRIELQTVHILLSRIALPYLHVDLRPLQCKERAAFCHSTISIVDTNSTRRKNVLLSSPVFGGHAMGRISLSRNLTDFWDTMQYSPLKSNRRLRKTWRINLRSQKISQQEAVMRQVVYVLPWRWRRYVFHTISLLSTY
jgi:hypothetical protein